MQGLVNILNGCDEAESVHILHLEDSPIDAELVRGMIEQEGIPCKVVLAAKKSNFETALMEKPFDLILCDHGLPGYDGFAALRLAREVQPDVPVIMISGELDDVQAVESLKGGATDYILKQRLARLIPAIRRALHEAKERAEKKKLEAAFLRTQRLDSIGTLAGGIAHDLNNALAPVLMSAELLQDCDSEEMRQRLLSIITSSTQRATGMVKQILGFVRGHGGNGPVILSQLVREMSKIVNDTFPKSIAVSTEIPGDPPWMIQGDPTELHQVVLNLCVNARDAMPEGGQLRLSAANKRLEQKAAFRLGATPGSYVLLAVGDTGSGIPPEVLPRIFEPFFTTKQPDKGTGLGLSTVASIVKRHGAFIDIKTEAGQGTEFRIYFPAIEGAQEIAPKSPETALPVGRGELVLLIEDEEAVCELTKTTLESYGYRVVTAQNGVQGISRFVEFQSEIKLLVTDTDMPYLDGRGAIRAIKEIKPDLPVIIASGSKQDAEPLPPCNANHFSNLGKPFSLEQLLIAVDLALHS